MTSPPVGWKTRGDRVINFVETFCRVTKESIGGEAGSLIRLRDWQKQTIRALYTLRPNGRLLYRHGLVGIARKNTKSTLGAGLALYELVMGKPGSEIYSCAGDKEQAKIVFNTAKAMVEIEPELKSVIHIYKDVLENETSGSVYRALSREAFTKEGLNPNLVIFDEVHVQPDDELWNVMELGAGARPEPLMLGITTAGVMTNALGEKSLCYGLYEYGIKVATGEIDDPTFFFCWWEPTLGVNADHRDPKVWAEANPGIGDLVAIEDFESTLRTTPEAEFRTKRTNVFVAASNAWLPYGAWAAQRDHAFDYIPDGAPVVLGFDGSYNNDSTVIVAATVGARPFVTLVYAWEKKDNADPNWVVPVDEVESFIIAACKRWKVREIAADPSRWEKSLQMLLQKGYPVVEFPQSPERMIPATQRFYEAVMNRLVSHDGNEVLARHLGNCVLKITDRGGRVVKQQRGSVAKIDAAVAAIMAYDRAAGPQGPAAGWLTYMKDQITSREDASANQVLPTAKLAPRAADFLVGPGKPVPTRSSTCQHRWGPEKTCVFCGDKKKEE